MEENTQLPKEVADQITQSAVEYANLLTFFSIDIQAAWEDGATAYATKLEQANEVIKVLEYDNNKLKGEVEGYKNAVEELTFESDKQRTEANEQLRGAKKLLNEVFRKHESGLLPDRFIYEKIKTFLYGE